MVYFLCKFEHIFKNSKLFFKITGKSPLQKPIHNTPMHRFWKKWFLSFCICIWKKYDWWCLQTPVLPQEAILIYLKILQTFMSKNFNHIVFRAEGAKKFCALNQGKLKIFNKNPSITPPCIELKYFGWGGGGVLWTALTCTHFFFLVSNFFPQKLN